MYKVFYHRLVLKEDFKKLSKVERKKIVKAIKKKLKTEPEVFGKALGSELKGYYRLRIDFYRVIYRIDKGRVKVFIVKAGLRKNSKVYIEAAKRLGLLK
ncbi:MAG: type II toxin-antitoxin system RelE/ParE family toxin [Nitrospirae bacterium]|nr:type II toxin-antitoxin system RelE/ParE family toxin [Nitrospirota bacterium]